MQLNNEFVVSASTEETWKLLTDLERVAPCMPGASIDGRDGEKFLGNVKIKVGPIAAQFRGTAYFIDQDDSAHKATIAMNGKDPKGQATVNATIHAWLEPQSGSSTRVFVDTDLDITGRMAQFGRGPIADVSARLIGQFTDNLSRELTGGPTPAGDVSPPTTIGSLATTSARPEPAAPHSDLNILAVLGPTIAKGALGPVIGFLLGFLVARAYPGTRR